MYVYIYIYIHTIIYLQWMILDVCRQNAGTRWYKMVQDGTRVSGVLVRDRVQQSSKFTVWRGAKMR